MVALTILSRYLGEHNAQRETRSSTVSKKSEYLLECRGDLVRHRERMKYIISAGLIMALLSASCTPYQQQGAAIGGVAGGALGAVAGGNSRSTVKGAALGAGLGAGIAAMQENNRRAQGQNQPHGQQPYGQPYGQQQAPYQAPDSDYPYAERTSTPGEVLSPYAPYNVIDVRGFRSGSKAKDPSCGKVFIVP